MPVNRTSKQHQQLVELIRGLPDGVLSSRLRKDPLYPTHAIPVSPNDEYYISLLQSAFGGSEEGPAHVEDDPPQFLEKNEGTVNDGSALFRFPDIGVVQVTYRKLPATSQRGRDPNSELARYPSRTQESTSVLGRLGVLDLVIEKLPELAKENGLSSESDLTISDLARLCEESNDPDSQHVRAMGKFLARLNNGDFVGEAQVERAAKQLGLAATDLAFDSPEVYRPRAKKARSEKHQEKRAKAERDLLMSLRAVPVAFVRADLRNPETIQALAALLQVGSEPEYPDQTEGRGPVEESSAIGALKLVAKGRYSSAERRYAPLHKAIEHLTSLEVWVWFGSYDKRVRLEEDDPAFMAFGVVRSQQIRVPVIAFTPADGEVPEHTVNQSSNVGTGATIEEALGEDPPAGD